MKAEHQPQHYIFRYTPVYGQNTLDRKSTTHALTAAGNTVHTAVRLGEPGANVKRALV